jgi:hypothetical protein
MPRLTPEQFEQRLHELLLAEINDPMSWWYLSYAGEEGFRGGAIIQAKGFTGACYIAGSILKISPGGEVMGLKIPPDKLPDTPYRHRLLTKAELRECWGDMETLAVLEGRSNDG